MQGWPRVCPECPAVLTMVQWKRSGELKTEMYYLKTFASYEELKQAVIDYIGYYNGSRYQKRLNCMTPLEYRYYPKNKSA